MADTTPYYFAPGDDEDLLVPLPNQPDTTVGHKPSPITISSDTLVYALSFRAGQDHRAIHVDCAEERYNRGDAESYAYNVMVNCLDYKGELYVRIGEDADEADVELVYSDCIFVSGSSTIITREASSRVELSLDFMQSTPEDATNPEPTFDPVDDYEEYEDRTSAADYKLVAVYPKNEESAEDEYALGDWAEIEFQVSQAPKISRIPRAYGIRIDNWGTASKVQITVTAHTNQLNRSVLEEYIRDLQFNVRDRQFNLVGNGNIFSNYVVSSVAPSSDPSFFTSQFTVVLTEALTS